MRPSHYAQLLAIARRATRRTDEADDLVQDALLEAVRTGRPIIGAQDVRWLAGIVRNRARMIARQAGRRRLRENLWQQQSAPTAPPVASADVSTILMDLPPALKSLAALALSGHNRREIAYLLDLPDPALRQRVVALKRHLHARGVAMPEGMPGLNLDLAYGRIRDALLPSLLRQGGLFASHDPDGHLFIVRRSQKP
jgi:DNA-directed RNA polymerase specialized sigma24 family protein